MEAVLQQNGLEPQTVAQIANQEMNVRFRSAKDAEAFKSRLPQLFHGQVTLVKKSPPARKSLIPAPTPILPSPPHVR